MLGLTKNFFSDPFAEVEFVNPTNTNGGGGDDGPSVVSDAGDFPFGVGANGEFPIIIVPTRRQDRYGNINHVCANCQ